jgi:AcrR family transcriptional regulator
MIGISKTQLLIAAEQIVETRGIEALNLKRIADCAGIRPNAIYKYFPNLDWVQNALTIRAMAALIEVHRDVSLQRYGRDALEAYAFAERSFGQAHPNLYAIAYRAVRGASPELKLLRQTYMGIAVRMLRGYNIPSATAAEIANCLSAALQGFISAEISGRGRSRLEFDRNYERLLDMFDAGARAAAADAARAFEQTPELVDA